MYSIIINWCDAVAVAGSLKPQVFSNMAQPIEGQTVPAFTRAASTPVRENTTAPKSLALDRDEFKVGVRCLYSARVNLRIVQYKQI